VWWVPGTGNANLPTFSYGGPAKADGFNLDVVKLSIYLAQGVDLTAAYGAAKAGFDEIQFDYVRFPSDGDMSAVVYPGKTSTPPGWVIASVTLAVAALAQPARRRIQQAVDRRFNRRRYNAAKTIEAFSTHLRDQVDLDTLTVELLAVVNHTVEPTSSSLWLRSQPQRERQTLPHNPED
jgi:hypothetical protein